MKTKTPGLYNSKYEHDSCGVGFVANIEGRPSHTIVKEGITILNNLVHRGAIGSDLKTGDGAGLLIQVPHSFFKKEADQTGCKLPPRGKYSVGFLFLPQEKKKRDRSVKIIEKAVKEEGGKILCWREVPIEPDCLGAIARESMPYISQVIAEFPGFSGQELERKTYVTRRVIEKEALKAGLDAEDFYIPSFSSRTIVYKGMFTAFQLEEFYPDFKDPDFKSAIALVHQRYSTNTFPSWPLAQPFRYIAHNGEINTLRGNINNMKAREATLASEYFGDDIKKLIPVIAAGGSDSAVFDNTYELLVSAGRSPEQSMMMMVPEAFGEKYHISEDRKAFYEYHASFMEPWDGPAAIAFSDGIRVGAALDRNGLRPARYVITRDKKIVLASEIGVLDIAPENVIEKGRLGPGKMIMADTSQKRVKKNNEIKAAVSRKRQYRRWLEKNKLELKRLFLPAEPVRVKEEEVRQKQEIFGYTLEDLKMIIAPMAENAQEPVGSMGDDQAPAVLSGRPQLFYRYFKQLFAQVTNPPIDPYRESLVMSLMSFVGSEKNLLDEIPGHCAQLKLPHPILTNSDMEKLLNSDIKEMKISVVDILFDISGKSPQQSSLMESRLDEVCREVEEKIDSGSSIVVISDRKAAKDKAPIPALLAVSAINNYLIKNKKRHLVGLVVETGEAKEVMDFAALVGFGASAINPYLAFETLGLLEKDGYLPDGLKNESAIDNYITAVKKGLLKIMSKMGISTIRSYKGAQIFEAVGLNSGFLDKYFPGVSSTIEGVGISHIEEETLARHRKAFSAGERIIDSGGKYHYRKNSEKHLLTPRAIAAFREAVMGNSYQKYREYRGLINDSENNLCTLRGLLDFKKSSGSIPLDEVEPAEKIIKRFYSSAMSFGSISPEAHETIAIAMNRLGAASNSGEGGEDEKRYVPLKNGDSKLSKVKQVASGRFGVTSNYLVHARELQIKMAQGAKPGEGGQLPGHKVDRQIAKVRSSTPGVMLISPPPHHDIYSIEDLAQLIYDLKNANPAARVSVKLVSEAGVGTVAAGVAKGRADMVLISGGDGGTGASPLSSVKSAGIPWEIGLAETHQTLVLNNLRDKIRVQVDGQLRTGRDIVIGAMLGAEEFGFGTASLLAMGCVMVRKCHKNTCPVGVATQDPELRKRFRGKPEYLINFIRFIARDVREIMAELGYREFNEMVGDVKALEAAAALDYYKSRGLDYSKILAPPEDESSQRYCREKIEIDLSGSLDKVLIEKAAPALEEKKKVELDLDIKNSNRAVGTMLSSEISRRYGSAGLDEDTVKINFTGQAGQSFGAFLAKGVSFDLRGDANDYVGKGLSGGRIIIRPPKGARYRPQNNIITGNVNLFGATSGELFIHGRAGERFAVRNSGATAVVEGVGDHGCEYMTGGKVVVLGSTGVNFAAGMSGGLAYVLDESQLFDTRCNLEMIDIEPVVRELDKKFLYGIIKKHVKYTRSTYAKNILRDWEEMLPKFVKVFPVDYKKSLARLKTREYKESEVVPVTEEVF